MQIKTASDLLALNTTELPLQVSGFPRSGSTAAERTLYRQLVINNPENFPGYVGELIRGVEWVEYQYRDVPVVCNIDSKKVAEKVKSMGNQIIHDGEHLGKSVSDKDINNVKDRIKMFDRYSYRQIFMKLFNHDIQVIAALDYNIVVNLLENNFWLFTYRKNYVDQIISFCYAFKTGEFHYYDNFDFDKKKVYVDSDILKRLMLLTYSNVDLIWNGRSNVAYIEKDQLNSLEDNTDKYLSLEVDRQLLPGTNVIEQPKNMINKSKDLSLLVENYDDCVKRARRIMSLIAKKSNGSIELSGDEIQLNVR